MSGTLWTTPARSRYFLIPHGRTPAAGSLRLAGLNGETASVSPEWVAPFEVTEEQARRVAKEQLGEALGEIRGAIDQKLGDLRRKLDEFNRTPVREDTAVSPDAVSALLELVKELPRAIGSGLSGDQHRVRAARQRLTAVQQRLKASGIDVEDHLANFPDRLAELRRRTTDGGEESR